MCSLTSAHLKRALSSTRLSRSRGPLSTTVVMLSAATRSSVGVRDSEVLRFWRSREGGCGWAVAVPAARRQRASRSEGGTRETTS